MLTESPLCAWLVLHSIAPQFQCRFQRRVPQAGFLKWLSFRQISSQFQELCHELAGTRNHVSPVFPQPAHTASLPLPYDQGRHARR